MSLAPSLLPVGLSFNRDAANATRTVPFQETTIYLNLQRTLQRFQNLILLVPLQPTEEVTDLSPLQKHVQAELWSPLPFGRSKWLNDIEGARTQLLQLERRAQSIRVQSTRHEIMKDLAEKRSTIKKLRYRVEEIGREVELAGGKDFQPPYEDEGDTLYDILQAQRQSRPDASKPTNKEDSLLQNGKTVTKLEDETRDVVQESESKLNDDLFSSSSIRRRNGQPASSNESSAAKTSGFSNLQSTERSLLDSSRVNEDITSSLISMAAQLKQQSNAMAFSLEQDKTLVNRALEGLDVSITGMEAASKKMVFLKRMSEEQGIFGRLKLYAMIFAMWIAAILLVFVGPKLRF